MSHDNHIIEAEITFIIKKYQVLGILTFRSYSSPQEIQNCIEVLGPKIFGSWNTS